MTAEEHELMLVLFANQIKAYRVLVEILRDRDVLKPDDLDAFEALIIADTPLLQALSERARTFYLKAAKECGVVVPAKT
jgi:hypothetical protein